MKMFVAALLIAVSSSANAQSPIRLPGPVTGGLHTPGLRGVILATANRLTIVEDKGIYEGTTHATMQLLSLNRGNKKQFNLKLINRAHRQPQTIVLEVISERINRCGVIQYVAQEPRRGFDMPVASMTLVASTEATCGAGLRGWKAHVVYSGGLAGLTEGELKLQGIPMVVLGSETLR